MDRADLIQFIHRAKQNKASELDLSNRGIHELPDELGEINSLKILNLSYNNITYLPSNLGNLVNLQKLYLTRNHISQIPLGIGNFKKLKVLDISYNPVLKLPAELGLLSNLEILDASFCNLERLPLELTNLYGLKNLNLEENPLAYPPGKVVKRGLYATMHFLSIEKHKSEASRVMLQIFNLPEKIQRPFQQYLHYFEQMISEASQKDVIFKVNFINQDFYKELDLHSDVESHLYDLMRYIHEKIEFIKQSEDSNYNEPSEPISEQPLVKEVRSKLETLSQSLDQKIAEMQKIKFDIKGLHDFLKE